MRAQRVGLILLAGGQGTRFGAEMPKQYQLLKGKPVALHPFCFFQECPEIDEIVVVCAEAYQSLFRAAAKRSVAFAAPGERRQDSVSNGFNALSSDIDLVCVHDAARPYPTKKMLVDVLSAAEQHGAATVGMPLKYTIKDCDGNGMVVDTPDRARFWEIQTPQVLQKSLLSEGLAKVRTSGLTVTDDTSLAELVGVQVKIVEGSHRNIKITTPEDLIVAEHLHV